MSRLLTSSTLRFRLAALAVLAASVPLAAQTTVRDSIAMSRRVIHQELVGAPPPPPPYSQEYYYSCKTDIIATWPDVRSSLNATGVTYVTPGVSRTYPIPSENYPYTLSRGQSGVLVYTLPGSLVIRGILYPERPDWTRCDARRAQTEAISAGFPTWYVVYTVTDGTPVARYTWRQDERLQVAFDGSFESQQSHEIDSRAPSGKRPVASYAWDFGDGQTGIGARPTHTYARPDTFAVTLTVTDDDGQTNVHTEEVVVAASLLSYRIESEETPVTRGGEMSLVATVTNVGIEDVENVEIRRGFALASVFADSLYAFTRRAPAVTGVPTSEPDVITQARLAPGESIEVRAWYSIDEVGAYIPAGASEYVPIESELHATLWKATAVTFGGDPVKVVNACESGGCDDVTVVRPSGPDLARRLVIDADTVHTRDTLVVRVEVRNGGTENFTDVVPGAAPTVDDVDAAPYDPARIVPPAIALIEGGPEPASVASLAPGETASFEYRFRISHAALWSDPDDGGQYRGVPSTVTFKPGVGAQGILDGNPVVADNDCGGEPCRADVVVAPLDVTIHLQAYVENTAVKEGAEVTTGLSYSVLTERATFYAGADLQGGCASGCVEIGVELTQAGKPMAHEDVRLSVPEIAASDDVTARPHGNWFVATAQQMGGAPKVDTDGHLWLTTDADGRASALYFAPGVTEKTPVTVTAYVEGEAEGIGVVGTEEEFDLVLVPNTPIERSFEADPVTTAYLRTLSAVIQASATGNTVGDFCENGFKWIRANAPLIGDGALDGGGTLRRNSTLYLSNLGVNATCGLLVKAIGKKIRGTDNLNESAMADVYAAAQRGSFVDLFNDIDGGSGVVKKFAQSHLFLYLLYQADLGGRLFGVVLPSPEEPPVYASFQGDFFDTSLAHLTEVMAAAPAGASYRIGLDFYELSALDASADLTRADPTLGSTMTFTPTSGGGAEQTFRDRSRYLYIPDVFLDTAPDGLTFIQEAVTTVGGAIPAAVGEATVQLFDGLSATLSGAVVQIGDELQWEINQILSVPAASTRQAGGGSETATVTFATPTLYAYPEGTSIRVLARGATGPPVPPTPVPAFVPAELVTLAWMPGVAVASSYDVEVATDTLFSNVVYTVSDTHELAVELTEAEVARDQILYWHVRGTNAAGDGPWSSWLPILVNDRPTPSEEAPQAVPTVVALGAPFPNPARSASATVAVDLPEAGPARLAVYDALGREVAVAFDGPQAAGRHAVALDTSRLPSGVYVVRLETGGAVAVQRLTVVR